jgi:nitroreductase
VVAQAAADGWPVRVIAGFADEPIERLCALDASREGVIALLPLGSGAPSGPPSEPEPIVLATEALSPREIDYPEIRAAHSAGSLEGGAEARRWRRRAPKAVAELGGGFRLPPATDPQGRALEEVIVRRGSSRRFRTEPISLAALATILRSAAAPLPADYRVDPAEPLVDLFVIVLAVDGLEPGRYRWWPRAGELELVSPAAERRDAGFLDLGQELAADAAANVYAIADLDRVLGALGDRGYRAAQLDGGISGGRAYLAAYALGLGATGLTFFDDAVAEYFGLDARRWGVMFLTAVGVPARPLLV